MAKTSETKLCNSGIHLTISFYSFESLDSDSKADTASQDA